MPNKFKISQIDINIRNMWKPKTSMVTIKREASFSVVKGNSSPSTWCFELRDLVARVK